MLENKLGISDSSELAKMEEKLSKARAIELFEKKGLKTWEAGSVLTLRHIHKFLFQDIYAFAGQIRTVNLAKGNFRFAPVLYLLQALEQIESMPQFNFDQIVEKYVEMNVVHPFREGNGRATRVWLDHIFTSELGLVVDWSKIDKQDYLFAMERSPIRDTELKVLLQRALVNDTESRQVFLKGLDASYNYEGMCSARSSDIGVTKLNLGGR